MELGDYILKFPSHWRGVFAPLSKNRQPVLCADAWLLESSEGALARRAATAVCYRGNHIDWAGFVEGLCEKEPTEIDGQLVFLPRVLLLPNNIQRTAVAFLRHRSAEIPVRTLETLLASLRGQPVSDDWTRHQLRGIRASVCRARCGGSCGTGHWEGSRRSELTGASRGLFESVCQRIIKAGRGSCDDDDDDESGRCKPQCDWLPGALTAHPRSCQHRMDFAADREMLEEPSLIPSEALRTNPLESSKTVSEHPIAKPVSTSNSPPESILIEDLPTPAMDVDRGAAEKTLPQTSGVAHVAEKLSPRDLVEAVDSEGPGRRAVTEKRQEDSERVTIDAVTMEKLASLKEATSTGDPSLSEHLRVIVECPIDQLEAACDVLELDSLPAASLASVARDLADFSLELSNSSAVILARRCFAKQIQDLTQTAPRCLLNAVVSLAKAFPKPTIEGALIPALTMGGRIGVPTPHQCDLVGKVAKDALTNESRAYLISKILSVKTMPWSEELTGLFQTLLGCKFELEKDTLEIFIGTLETHGGAQNACAKFAKLLLAVINRFSKQVSTAGLASLQRLADSNRTFLKKALQSAIKRVKG